MLDTSKVNPPKSPLPKRALRNCLHTNVVINFLPLLRGVGGIIISTSVILNNLTPLLAQNHAPITAKVKSLSPPLAPKKPHKEVRHSQVIYDNYFWLRDKQKPEVLKYLKAENKYTEAMTANLKPLQKKLYQEMRSRVQENTTSITVSQGNYDYYTRYLKGKNYAIHCRKQKTLNAKEEILIDENEIAARNKYLKISMFNVSNDGNLLAVGIDTKGDLRYNLQIKDLRNC